jgi:hypothetical protein
MTNWITNFVFTVLCVSTSYQLLPGNVTNQRDTNAAFLYQPMICQAVQVITETTRVLHYRTTNTFELTGRVTNGPPVWRAPEGPPPLPTYPGFFPSKQ